MEHLYLDVSIDTISEKCTIFVPPKPAPLINSQLVMFEKQLCDSHLDEKFFEENAAVKKI